MDCGGGSNGPCRLFFAENQFSNRLLQLGLEVTLRIVIPV